MWKKLILCLIVFSLLCGTSSGADYIHWVEFDVGTAALEKALALDITAQEQEQPTGWIDILALAATRSSGKPTAAQVEQACTDLRSGLSPQTILGEQYKTFAYYREAYGAALGGLVGNYAIAIPGEDGKVQWQAKYGLKAFSPIAAGYWYNHYDDFGASRSYGFARPHLGNDLMGSLGTPIVAVEGGTIEAMGWNQYGGWRIGIRSQDRKRYYYYAHLRKDNPFAPGLKEGDTVAAGDLIGFMGRTGYSAKENVNNIETVHLHFGLQLIFDESQKECNSEIWIDVYSLINLLSTHRSSVAYDEGEGTWRRLYEYRDLDAPESA